MTYSFHFLLLTMSKLDLCITDVLILVFLTKYKFFQYFVEVDKKLKISDEYISVPGAQMIDNDIACQDENKMKPCPQML